MRGLARVVQAHVNSVGIIVPAWYSEAMIGVSFVTQPSGGHYHAQSICGNIWHSRPNLRIMLDYQGEERLRQDKGQKQPISGLAETDHDA